MKIKVRSILQQALDDLNTLASAKKGEEIYIGQMEAKAQALLEHIAYLQRKEYNNSKAIEYIKKHAGSSNDYTNYWITTESIDLLKILKGDKDE